MTSKSKYGNVLFFTIVIFLMLPLTAFADGGQSSGVDTILRSSTLQGQDYMRDWVANLLNKPISFIISIAGFLIITFSFLRVVLTLLYLTFPDIFNKVSEFRKEKTSGGFKDKGAIDMISYVFALILPDIKSLTDYANESGELDATPMDYLKKKGPMIVIFIVLGAMIFDGTARAFLAKASDIGLLFGNIFVEHDTVAMVEGIIDKGDRYEFVYDTSKLEGIANKEMATKLQRHIHGLHPTSKNPEFADKVGKFVEGQVKGSLKTALEKGAKTGNITGINEIVSFNMSITSRSSKNDNQVGTGMAYIELTGELVPPNGDKYILVRFSQIRDKYNRTALYSTQVETSGNTAPQTNN